MITMELNLGKILLESFAKSDRLEHARSAGAKPRAERRSGPSALVVFNVFFYANTLATGQLAGSRLALPPLAAILGL